MSSWAILEIREKLEWQIQGGERGLDNFCGELCGNGAASTKYLGFMDAAAANGKLALPKIPARPAPNVPWPGGAGGKRARIREAEG